jgi:hypothetical protein
MLPENVMGRDQEPTCWAGYAPVWFILDLKKYEIFLTDFTLRHGSISITFVLQNWQLEGLCETFTITTCFSFLRQETFNRK